jgi:trigger factor
LLCGTRHTEATNHLLTSAQIAQADSKPYNVQHGVSTPYGLHFQGESFDCVIGGNSFSSRLRDNEHATLAFAISVDDTDLVWFRIDRSGNLFLNANVFDENNLPLLVIHENSLAYRTAATWDIEFKGRKLTVREAARKILFEIEFIPPGKVVIDRARLLCNGVEILVRKSHVFVVNSQQLFVKCESVNCDVGLQLGRNCRGLGAGFSSNPETLCRYHLLPDEVRRRERQALKEMEHTMRQFGISLDPESPT